MLDNPEHFENEINGMSVFFGGLYNGDIAVICQSN